MKKRLGLWVALWMFLFLLGVPGVAHAAESTGVAAPAFTTVTRKGSGKTSVSWSKVSAATGYELQYCNSESYIGARSLFMNGASATSKKISGLSGKQDTFLRVRAYKTVGGQNIFSDWSANVKVIVWKSSWTYAGYSKIHSDPVILYYSQASNKKNKTIAVNAGHGCSGGSSKKTLSHPNGTAKVTGGTTAAGAKYSIAISSGTTVKGTAEQKVNLKIAQKLKAKLLNEGYNVLMIRQDSNTRLDNIARTVMANNNADCHIAIHFDSTTSNKGAFAITVPNVGSYRSMQPVASNWQKHNSLGSSLISGLRSAGVKIWGKGTLSLDLTQTSYSRIASIDIEVGDSKTSISNKNLNKIATGLFLGVKKYF